MRGIVLSLLAALCLAGGALAVQAGEVEFVLPDMQGEEHALSDYRGKWVVVNYWATWCPPCLDEIPELVAFHEAHAPEHAVVLGVNFEEVDPEYLRGFVEQYFVSYPVLLSEPGSRTAFGPLFGLPTTYIVSPAGKVVEHHTGGVTQEALEAMIEAHKGKFKNKTVSID